MSNKNYDVILEFGIKQTMRDGINLSSYIYRPDSKSKFPVILTRTPYSTVDGFFKRFDEEARFFASKGYVYMIQDCRGKNESDGVFNPFYDDNYDGYDTIKWILSQKWSNGNIGTIGASYSAWNQWATAVLDPPGLKTMISIVALPDPVINVPYQNGVLVLPMAEWMAIIEGRRNIPAEIYNTEQILWHLPLKTIDKEFGRTSNIWNNWIAHPSADDFWTRTFYQDKLDRIHIPVLHVSGWYDDDLIGTHLNYTTVTHSPKFDQSYYQKLIIGPWQHKVNRTTKIGDIDFGNSALIDLRNIELNWFNRFLKDEDNGINRDLPVEIFVMGENKWKKYSSWPPENIKYVPYYLHSKGKANSLYGDGLLNDSAPIASESIDKYVYDPSNPVRCVLDPQEISAEGPFDQRPVERRDDVLVYQTDPIERDIEVSGPIKLKLFVSSSAIDTDFWAQVTDVYPNGYSMHLTENILRATYRNSLKKYEKLNSEEIYEIEIDLWAISNLFKKDHCIRLDVSSSCFPKYNRNLNNGHKYYGEETKFNTAVQKIYHNQKHPSQLMLPILKK
ncbi:MAG: CocE/NonD family hydrolase [Thermoplasmata archaeon]